jgi:15-cis-phytoene desaturase
MALSSPNLNWKIGPRNISKLTSSSINSDTTISLSFSGSVSMGLNLRLNLASTRSAKTSNRFRNHGYSPLKVVCIDYPRPEIDNTVNFIEAAYLSSTFRAYPRPSKPLKVVIAGAGNKYPFHFIYQNSNFPYKFVIFLAFVLFVVFKIRIYYLNTNL